MAEVTKEKILSLAQQYAMPGNEDKPEVAEESSDQQVVADETPEIKLETAPVDFRFPTTNQSRHSAKGEGSSECEKFAKYYPSLCPGEWVDRWNEQWENGTFPGPL
ncbi:hypothetical protein MKW92_028330 [Papaver armeniacum]|nr:hypothetical protein MKW92_028330 [Papaver armeniacum]